MAQMTLADLSEKMKDLYFCMLFTKAASGSLVGRPMSNNGEVDYDGDSCFFSDGATRKVADIERDARVALSFAGQTGLFGKPPLFLAVDAAAELIRDKAQFEAHWTKDLDRWFAQGVETPGLVLIKVRASRVHYWDGEDEGELTV